MRKSSRVFVTGPLQPYASGYRLELARQGYSPWTAIAHLHLLAHVSRWLADNQLTAADLDAIRVSLFLADRRASGQVRRLTPRGMIPLLGYLRELHLVPAPIMMPPVSARDSLVGEFAEYLRAERGDHRLVSVRRWVVPGWLRERSSGGGRVERHRHQRVRARPVRAAQRRIVEQHGDLAAGAAALVLSAWLYGDVAGGRRAAHGGLA